MTASLLRRWWVKVIPADHPPPPTWRGLLALLLTSFFLYSSFAWLRSDPRLASQVVLTAALDYVLSYGALDTDAESVFRAAAIGLTSRLDPYSGYMPPEELAWFEEATGGEYVGIGVEVKITSGAIVIVRVLPQSSAAEARLSPGDRIISIDDTPTAGFTLLRAIELMRGTPGTVVRLRVQHFDGHEDDIALERRAVSVSPFPVHGVARSGCGYIRWTDFTSGSADRLAAIVEGITVQDPTGLVIDLRGNPGGILEEAVDAAGVFLPPNSLVCRLVERGQSGIEEFHTKQPPAQYPGPLVLVLDEQSASASEVFAAALQEEGRAVVVGRKSFGKGWVQNIFPFYDGGALRLSTGRYYTPMGRTFGDPYSARIEDTLPADSFWAAPAGLDPDIAVPAPPVGPWEEELGRLGVFADFVIAQGSDWPEEHELIDRLRDWCDSLAISPEGLGHDFVENGRPHAVRSQRLKLTQWEDIVLALDTARQADAELLFDREAMMLVVLLLEQRLIASDHSDEEELEAYLSLDPDLSVALDLIEDSDRYAAIVQKWQTLADGVGDSAASP